MIVTTLGTSHGDPTPTRFNSAILLGAAGRHFLLDAGEPVTASLIRLGVSPSQLGAIFVTHMHGDHVGGLPVLLKYLDKHATQAPTRLYLPEAGAVSALGGWMQAMHRDWPVSTLETRMMTAGEIYYDDLLSVKAIPTTHLAGADGEAASYALAVDFSDKRLVYTGDLSADLGDLPQILFDEPTDLCIMEVQHYEVRDALPLLARCPIRKLVLTHVADRWSNDEEALLSALDLLPYPCVVAHDGDQFVV